MMSRGATRVIRSVVGPPRCFLTAAIRMIGTDSATTKIPNGAAGFFPLNPDHNFEQSMSRVVDAYVSERWETYKANVEIDLKKRHVPVTFLDKVAFWTVKSLKYPTDLFFQIWVSSNDAGNRGGGPQHGGRNAPPLQIPQFHRNARIGFTGYLAEEAIHSYAEFFKELDVGRIENVPAPAITVDYWQLPPEATLRDVVVIVRADEAHHRDVNHFASDIHYQGHELKEAPAPLGYH
ncbi:hypothetical protein RHMOL_Rhmol11G0086000 [Rhododendron molle]|uniref:Uncharacterized protein n=2 Tax=Rhododendron molle TaxID=49168 RepID=A0ACC0LQD7_RHOML|nr:hypothetical protein RHMOL_Rhmol11G0086000 [Rhododendron molle]KAI8530783.1 hypothetical protein RHMOL_Rhmol11G0086000 [Rhododendron molle]